MIREFTDYPRKYNDIDYEGKEGLQLAEEAVMHANIGGAPSLTDNNNTDAVTRSPIKVHINDQQSTFKNYTNTSDAALKLTMLPPSTLHIFQYGEPRTATTTQFNLACVSLFLHIQSHHPHLLNNTICHFIAKRTNVTFQESFILQRDDIPQAMKSHINKLPGRVRNTTVLFTTAVDKSEHETKKQELESKGHTVGMVQDLETLGEIGIEGYIDRFVHIFNLTSQHKEMMVSYFEDWDKIRQCCGMQMSKYYRNELVLPNGRRKGMKAHAFCTAIDINDLENHFMNTDLYKLIDGYTLMRRINRPSIVDGDLDGSYCSRYNDAVRTHTRNELNSKYPGVKNNFKQETEDPIAGLQHLLRRSNA